MLEAMRRILVATALLVTGAVMDVKTGAFSWNPFVSIILLFYVPAALYEIIRKKVSNMERYLFLIEGTAIVGIIWPLYKLLK